jgi:hypothetical protein
VLSNVVLDVTVDRLVTWNEIVPDRLEVATARLDGVLPLAAGLLAERFPDLWATPKAARREIEDAVSKPQTPNRDSYLGTLLSGFGVVGRRVRSEALGG